MQKKCLMVQMWKLRDELFTCIKFISISEEAYIELRQLYLIYEFSDKFRMISTDGNYGTLWNYVKTGLLTPEEAVEALLK